MFSILHSFLESVPLVVCSYVCSYNYLITSVPFSLSSSLVSENSTFVIFFILDSSGK